MLDGLESSMMPLNAPVGILEQSSWKSENRSRTALGSVVPFVLTWFEIACAATLWVGMRTVDQPSPINPHAVLGMTRPAAVE